VEAEELEGDTEGKVEKDEKRVEHGSLLSEDDQYVVDARGGVSDGLKYGTLACAGAFRGCAARR